MLIAISAVTFIVVMGFFVHYVENVVLRLRKKKVDKPTSDRRQVSDRKKFKTEFSRIIWARYSSLSDENKVYPELRDTLMNLDELSIQNGYAAGVENGTMQIRHVGGCHYHLVPSHNFAYKVAYRELQVKRCCQQYVTLMDAVMQLDRAEAERRAAIAKAEKKIAVSDLNSKLSGLDALATRMKNEAQIHRAVTEEVFE